jgi:hypothetical protein
VSEENSEYSPLLGLVAALLALLVVLVEAHAMSPPTAGLFVPPDSATFASF